MIVRIAVILAVSIAAIFLLAATRPGTLTVQRSIVINPGANSTRVSWTAHMQAVYPMKVMGLFLNMDSFIGKHLQSGVDALKAAAETSR